jgi:5'-methylthioadenosine phosphorylase
MTRKTSRVGVIAGTGVTEHFDLGSPKVVGTRFGKATVYESGSDYVVVPRHGPGHRTPPHAVNYRANIAALSQLGVKEVIATSAVGSMDRGFRVGGIGLVEQFLDFTKQRPSTFYEDEVVHTDMTYPYSRSLNRAILVTAKKARIEVRPRLVYVCVEGPRFETAAEIRMYRAMGGDVVGMTGVPEVVLAREKGLEYSSLVIATNWAAGMQGKVSHDEVLKVMKAAGKEVKLLIDKTVAGLREA